MEKTKKEDIWNIPTAITSIRVILTLIIIYIIFNNFNITWVIVLFLIAVFSDYIDGIVARRYKSVTGFGRRFDVVADKFLLIGTAIAIIIKFKAGGILTVNHLAQILMIFSRDIVAIPLALSVAPFIKHFPRSNLAGKITTAMQGITFPLIILSVFYSVFNFSLYFAILTGIVGLIAAYSYIKEYIDIIRSKWR